MIYRKKLYKLFIIRPYKWSLFISRILLSYYEPHLSVRMSITNIKYALLHVH